MLLAAVHGRAGTVYFLTDGPPVEFRGFIAKMLATQGLDAGARVLPLALARVVAVVAEAVWSLLRLPGAPPLTRTALALTGHEVTVRDDLARRELGYEAKVTREAGLAAMAQS